MSYSGWYQGFLGTAWEQQPLLLADVNGDQRADIIGFGIPDTGVVVALSTSTSFSRDNWAQNFDGFQDATIWDGSSFRMAGDMNGDGLMDLAGFNTTTGTNVALSTGKGFLTLNNWSTDFGENGDWGGNENPILLNDFNQDGLADVIGFNDDGVTIGISAGTGFANVIGPILSDFDNNNYDNNDPRVASDINGDGLPDIVGFNDSGVQAVLNTGPRPDLIDTIQNGLKEKIAIVYESLSDPNVYSHSSGDALSHFQSGSTTVNSPNTANILPYDTRQVLGGQRYVVSAYEHSFTSKLSPDASYVYSYALQYKNAQINLDGRGWQGFETASHLNNTTGSEQVLTYNLDFPLTGSLKTIQHFCGPNPPGSDPKAAAGDTLSSITHNYQSVVTATGASGSGDKNIYLVHKDTTIKSYYFYNDYKYSTATSNSYDDFGNIVLVSDFGYVSRLGSNVTETDDLYTLLEYYPSDLSQNWTFGKLEYKKQSSQAATATIGSFQKGIDQNLDYYVFDTKSNLLSHAKWDDLNNEFLAYNYGYDTFGNRIFSVYPGGDTTKIYFETAYNTFPETKVSPRNEQGDSLVIRWGYDPRFGHQVAKLDPNGNVSIKEFDDFGRIIQTQVSIPANPAGIKSDENALNEKVTGSAAADFKGAQVVTVSKHTYAQNSLGNYQQDSVLQSWPIGTSAPDFRWHKAYFDGMHRQIHSVNQGELAADSIFKDVRYNANNGKAAESLPYHAGSTPLWTSYTYDIYNRKIAEIHPLAPDGTKSSTTTFSYGKVSDYQIGGVSAPCDTMARTIASGSPNAYTETSFFRYVNAKSKIVGINVPGYPQNSMAHTLFKYDLLGRRIGVMAPGSLPDTVLYDATGRLYYASNPSRGAETHFFDPNTGLITKTVNTRTTSFYMHDNLNRIIAKKFIVNTNPSDTLIQQYTWDDTTPGNNGLGQISQVTISENSRDTYTAAFTYNKFQQVFQKTVTIDSESYTTAQVLNPMSQISTYIYPDKSELFYDYHLGFLKGIRLFDKTLPVADTVTYANYSEFDPFGNPQSAIYANGVSTTFSYAPTGQLLRQAIANQDSTFYNKKLDWNELYKVAATTDSTSLVPEIFNDTLLYDHLRLAQVKQDQSQKSQTFKYDFKGNYSPDPANKIAVFNNYQLTSLTSTDNDTSWTMTYDQLGNMSAWNEKISSTAYTRAFSYNQNNRLDTINYNNSPELSFSYDYKGQRTIKSDLVNQLKWTYVDPAYQVIGSGVSNKMISGPFGLVASVTRSSASPPLLPGVPQKGILFFHQDHLNSVVLTTDSLGKHQSKIKYAAYGKITQMSGPDNFIPKFTGKELDYGQDPAFSLYYSNARYYSPEFGRFITADNQLGGKFTDQDAFNRYAYALNDPLNHIDPSGHSAGTVAADVGMVFLDALEVIGGIALTILTDGAAAEILALEVPNLLNRVP